MILIEKENNPWVALAEKWRSFHPPGRPSKQEIATMAAMLRRSLDEKAERGKNRFEVLVLGATPEIREMLAGDDRCRVTVVDVTLEMIMAMTRLMARKNSDEVWIRSDWISAPLPEGYFDAILSDLVICNILPEQHVKFFERMRALLNDGGCWINRVYCVDANTQIQSLDALLSTCGARPAPTDVDVNNFRSCAGLAHWDPETGILDWSKLLSEMNRYRQNGRFIHPEPAASEMLERLYELFKPFDKLYWIATREQTEELFGRYFTLAENIHDESVLHLQEKGYYIHKLARGSSGGNLANGARGRFLIGFPPRNPAAQAELDNHEKKRVVMASNPYTIIAVEPYLVNLPVSERVFPFNISYGAITGLRRVFVKITTVDGNGLEHCGWGEAAPIYPYSSETPLGVYGLLKNEYARTLRGVVLDLGSATAARDSVMGVLDVLSGYLSNIGLNFTQTAIDMALFDLAARVNKVPIFKILSPGLERKTPYGVRACWSTKIDTPQNVAANTFEFAAKGYSVKVKLGGDAAHDGAICLAAVDAALSAGGVPSVGADANGGFAIEDYWTLEQHLLEAVGQDTLNSIDFFIEDPIDLKKYTLVDLVRLIRETNFRIMIDESLSSLEKAGELIAQAMEHGILNKLLFNIKIQRVGGFRNAMVMADLARRYDIPMMLGGIFPSAYGKQANCHFAMLYDGLLPSDGVDPSTDYIGEETLVVEDLRQRETMRSGYRDLSWVVDSVGMGVTVDEEKLRQHALPVDLAAFEPDISNFRIEELFAKRASGERQER